MENNLDEFCRGLEVAAELTLPTNARKWSWGGKTHDVDEESVRKCNREYDRILSLRDRLKNKKI